ncbi:hypothetical protein [Hymenobacter sp. GOD-10R]|uniref:hypothetical protein n=1 Tax=Hymenobacter sp. GOD-10R TaxID=3093922 RepID=UPI002D77624D|nr:hypothetical protein [Hymenobacter sp. GOD-10R]WRQ31647.1 hypothetical protein SD425_27835 [Hymenobacter sp. GOD-10R]
MITHELPPATVRVQVVTASTQAVLLQVTSPLTDAPWQYPVSTWLARGLGSMETAYLIAYQYYRQQPDLFRQQQRTLMQALAHALDTALPVLPC